jgi:hypothetical protein
MANSLTVIGGSIASLAMSLLTARRGIHVDLYLDPSRIGGSFGGIAVGDRRFDLGSRLFELQYEDPCSLPISAFDSQQDNHRPFIASVAEFIRDILKEDLTPAPTPEMWINGHRTRCVLMTVDLSDLPSALSSADRALVLEQSRRILETSPHPTITHQTLCEASVAQHGQRLHTLLTEAVCAKQYAGWRDVPASERRKLWVALFHAQTVFEAFAGLPITFRPHRPFFTTVEAVAHPFVRRLYQAVQAASQIAIIPAGSLTSLSFTSHGMVNLRFGQEIAIQAQSERCVLGLPPESLFAASGVEYAPERITSSIVWIDVAERHIKSVPSTLMICDPDLRALRISNAGRTPGWQTFAVEFGSMAPSYLFAVAALQRSGLVADGAEVRLAHQITGPSQIAPTAANRSIFEAALTHLTPFRGVLLGGARRFGFESLNDQLADALYYSGAIPC